MAPRDAAAYTAGDPQEFGAANYPAHRIHAMPSFVYGSC